MKGMKELPGQCSMCPEKFGYFLPLDYTRDFALDAKCPICGGVIEWAEDFKP